MEFMTLLPRALSAGERRSGVLYDDEVGEGNYAHVAAKLMVPDDEADDRLLQIKVWVNERWVQIVLNESGDIAAYAVADSEKDSWTAARAILRRKDYITE